LERYPTKLLRAWQAEGGRLAAADSGVSAERLQRDYDALLGSVLDEQRGDIAERQDAAESSAELYEAM
jgi:hypothetical protein